MEKKVLNQLSHPNIIKLYHTFQDDQSLYFLMEYHRGGELWSKLMHEEHQIGMDEDSARFYIADVINGLDYLASKSVVHRDLKPENLILSEDDGHVRICDFGTAKDLVDTTLNGAHEMKQM